MKKLKELLFETLCIAVCIAIVAICIFFAYVKFMFFYKVAFG